MQGIFYAKVQRFPEFFRSWRRSRLNSFSMKKRPFKPCLLNAPIKCSRHKFLILLKRREPPENGIIKPISLNFTLHPYDALFLNDKKTCEGQLPSTCSKFRTNFSMMYKKRPDRTGMTINIFFNNIFLNYIYKI